MPEFANVEPELTVGSRSNRYAPNEDSVADRDRGAAKVDPIDGRVPPETEMWLA